jgi:hypothetical protein
MLSKKNSLGVVAIISIILALCSFKANRSEKFYVDPLKGDDGNKGTVEKPFKTFDKALLIVGERVKKGQLSDKIFLRGGVYRKMSEKTSYWLDLKGTPDDYSLISAMPCEAGTPGCVQRESGKWYEKVVFDDSQKITSAWRRVDGHDGVWATTPGYVRQEWTIQNLWPWRRTKVGFPVTDHDETPASTLFTVAPYMLLQDGQPTIWVDSLKNLTEAGLRTYDHATGTLYVKPLDNKDPNQSVMETWYGGEQEYDKGMLYLDGEGRGMFHGNMEYAGIVGCEFRMFVRLFEFQRRGYKREQDREIQRYVKMEDNSFQYGWVHFLLDANTIYEKDGIRPHFEDRSNWLVRNNVFYRPSREVFQVHGADHVFENNVVIDHNGPWAGPAACVGMMNARNMNNLLVRHNYIVGHGNSSYHPGTVFMMEAAGRNSEHSKGGDYIYDGPDFENNFIADITAGDVFVLGKGDIRMRDITIRNNIIATNRNGTAIQIAAPQKNLKIENNIFCDQSSVISVYGKQSPMKNPPLPSSVSIRNNIFMNNRKLIDQRFFDTPEGSVIAIEHNWFSNRELATGTDIVKSDVEFVNPEKFDFRIKSTNPKDVYAAHIGPYGGDDPAALVTLWKKYFEKAPKSLPVK